MKTLLRRLLERAESAGGEDWIRRCLALDDAGEEGQAAGREGSVEDSGAADGHQEGPAPEVQPPHACRPRRSRAAERPASLAAADESQRLQVEGGDAPLALRSGTRPKRTLSASSERRGHRRSRGRNPAQSAQATPPLQAPAEGQQDVHSSRRHLEDTLLTAPSGLQPGNLNSAFTMNDIPLQQSLSSNAHLPLLNSLVSSFSKLAEAVVAQRSLSSPAVLSPSNVWSSIQDSPVIPPSVDILSHAVPETSVKEVLPCEMSPLGFHLSHSLKEKIWKGEFIDILSLLPSSKEFLKLDKKSEEKADEDRRRPVARSFSNWLQAFCIFSSIMGEKFPERCSGLFQHLEIILEAYKNFGGLGWFYYDESFRQKLAVYPSLKWGMKDVGLWLNLIIPQKPLPSKQPLPAHGMQSPYKKGYCFAFNESQCRWGSSCRYKHECSFCFGPHPLSKCFKKSTPAASQRDIFSKSLHSSEAGKHAPLAINLPRQGESQSLN